MTATTTLDSSTAHERDGSVREPDVAALVLVWSASDPARIGEVLLPRGDGEPAVFGRGAAEGSEARAELVRQRPGRDEATLPLDNPFISRRHLVIAAEAGGIAIENLGKKPLLHDGETADSELVVRAGETIEIPGQAMFLCVDCPRVLPAAHVELGGFGEADAHGIVGESAVGVGPARPVRADRCTRAPTCSCSVRAAPARSSPRRRSTCRRHVRRRSSSRATRRPFRRG